MMESLYGDGLELLGLWVATSLVLLLVWGLLAWAVVKILSRQRSRRRWASATNNPESDHMRHTVSDDASCCARSENVAGPA